MKRLVPLIMVLAVMFMFIPFSYAVTMVDSPLVEPIPETITDVGTKTYKQYYVVNRTNGTYLYSIEFTLPANEQVILCQSKGNQKVRFLTTYTSIITVQYNKYDVERGTWLEGQRINSSAESGYLISGYNTSIPFRAGYFPKESVNDSTYIGGYPITDLTIVQYNPPQQDLNLEPFVNWTEVPPDTEVLKSYMSEPIADEYNKYFVICRDDGASLYWIAIQKYMYQYTNANTWEYEGQIITETLVIGETASYGFVYNVPSALNDVSYYAYAMQITEFDLETGRFIRSQTYAGESLGQTVIIDITAFEIEVSEINSMAVYGINYINNGNLINRATITWAVSPTFEQWKQDVKGLLQSILDALSEDSEEVTIETETGALNELDSENENVKVTNEQGSEIKADEAAEEAFSKAKMQIDDLNQPVSFIKETIGGLYNSVGIVFVPVIVALALGLLATILGRKRG